jgi:ribosomal-protein-alanine N-acetyltransferase
MYLVVLKETGVPTGVCGLVKRDGLDGIDIGYAFLPQHWSKGYATEATLAVKEYAKNTVGLKRLVAITDPDNQGSIRVLEKIGLSFKKMIKFSSSRF